MNLPPDKVKVLTKYDNKKKWKLICDQASFAFFKTIAAAWRILKRDLLFCNKIATATVVVQRSSKSYHQSNSVSKRNSDPLII